MHLGEVTVKFMEAEAVKLVDLLDRGFRLADAQNCVGLHLAEPGSNLLTAVALILATRPILFDLFGLIRWHDWE